MKSFVLLLPFVFNYVITSVGSLTVTNNTFTIWARYGSQVIMDCTMGRFDGEPFSVFWVWNRKQNRSNTTYLSGTFNNSDLYENSNNLTVNTGVYVLSNGSLQIIDVHRINAGLYYCIISDDYGNETFVYALRLNYDIVSIATLNSIIVGLASASGFFLIAVFIGLTRYLAFVCSTKEKRKRKSIRAVLEAIQDYKSAQFDRFSAYRSAKMGQLSAFKSATIGHLSAFRNARVDQLRTYKQATVTSILAHLERMREHYAAQTARIKENCALQAERLRDSYSSRRGRFKNYRSHQVDKMRENYQAQAARIREYGMMQMNRLREQYKTQQQHVLKLVELLDVGSCVSGVIEAECMRAESMIFDADIAFDFEAQPARVAEASLGEDEDDDSSSSGSDVSHYVSALCSDISVESIVDNAVVTPGHHRIDDLNESVFADIDLSIDAVDIDIANCIASLSRSIHDA